MTRGGSSWRVPLALVVLGLIPVISGSLRLIEAAGGPQLMPINPRIEASPAPLVVHVLAATVLRPPRRVPVPRPAASPAPGAGTGASGRILVGAGLAVAGSGLWMTLFYSGAPGGVLLWTIRLAGRLRRWPPAIVLGFTAIRRRDIAAHRAWMIRAYALGLAPAPRRSPRDRRGRLRHG